MSGKRALAALLRVGHINALESLAAADTKWAVVADEATRLMRAAEMYTAWGRWQRSRQAQARVRSTSKCSHINFWMPVNAQLHTRGRWRLGLGRWARGW